MGPLTVKIKLDAKIISALELPQGKAEDFAWDTELDGFGLRLRRRTSGDLKRTYIVQYRSGRQQRRSTIGSDKITPAQARDAARKILARVELGDDPQAEKAAKRQRQAHTFRATVETYLDAKQGELRPVSHRINKLYLSGPYFTALHPMAIAAITRADVAACIRTIVRKHSVPTAAAARRALSAFFAWAVADGLLGNGANPVDGSHRPEDPKPRDHVPTAAELVAIWNACDGTSDFDKSVRLLILLGNRRQEVGGMRWSEIDAGVWTLPADRSKNGRAHVITLPPPASAIVESVPRTSRDCLFGDRASAGFTGWSRGKLDLDRKLAGTVRPFHLHDLRRAVATGMADLGIEPHHIEAALNHFSGHRRGVAGTYNRSSYENAVKAALLRWSEHVLALVEGRESNVVALQRA
jgi:integrase